MEPSTPLEHRVDRMYREQRRIRIIYGIALIVVTMTVWYMWLFPMNTIIATPLPSMHTVTTGVINATSTQP